MVIGYPRLPQKLPRRREDMGLGAERHQGPPLPSHPQEGGQIVISGEAGGGVRDFRADGHGRIRQAQEARLRLSATECWEGSRPEGVHRDLEGKEGTPPVAQRHRLWRRRDTLLPGIGARRGRRRVLSILSTLPVILQPRATDHRGLRGGVPRLCRLRRTKGEEEQKGRTQNHPQQAFPDG